MLDEKITFPAWSKNDRTLVEDIPVLASGGEPGGRELGVKKDDETIPKLL